MLRSQTLKDSETNLNVEKAEYLKEDITQFLCENLKYPIEAQHLNIEGDVIVSFVIKKNGKLDSLSIVNSPSEILTLNSLISLNQLDEEWSPCKVNGNPIDNEYLLVYRYRTWLNTQPTDYKIKAEKLIEKQKYEKALKYYNKAINENQFDYKLYESRSKIEEILGDTENATIDYQQATRLKNKVISIVDVTALRIRRETKLIRTEVIRVER